MLCRRFNTRSNLEESTLGSKAIIPPTPNTFMVIIFSQLIDNLLYIFIKGLLTLNLTKANNVVKCFLIMNRLNMLKDKEI